MRVDIRSIGNSRGIILPRAILEQCRLEDRAELEIRDGKIVISRPNPRTGWDEAFQHMAGTADDRLLDEIED